MCCHQGDYGLLPDQRCDIYVIVCLIPWAPRMPVVWTLFLSFILLSLHRNFGISTALAALESQAKITVSQARSSPLSGALLSATHLWTNAAWRMLSLGPKRAKSPGMCRQTPPSRRRTGTPQTAARWRQGQPMGRTTHLCGQDCVAWGRTCISSEASLTLSKLRGTELECLPLGGS